MRTIDFPRQYRVVAGGAAPAGTYIMSCLIPCIGQISRVTGQLILTCKDYTNQPTIDQLDLQFGSNVFNLMANQLQIPGVNMDTYAGVAVAPNVSLKETDVGIEIDDFITAPGGRLVLTVNFSVVPDPFMFYIRPRLKVSPFVFNPKPDGGRQEVSAANAFALPPQPYTAVPMMGPSHDVNENEVGKITVVKETIRTK